MRAIITMMTLLPVAATATDIDVLITRDGQTTTQTINVPPISIPIDVQNQIRDGVTHAQAQAALFKQQQQKKIQRQAVIAQQSVAATKIKIGNLSLVCDANCNAMINAMTLSASYYGFNVFYDNKKVFSQWVNIGVRDVSYRISYSF